jgi:hypothetical protein
LVSVCSPGGPLVSLWVFNFPHPFAGPEACSFHFWFFTFCARCSPEGPPVFTFSFSVGIIEGRDSQLKNTFVAFGAHYDHVGYAEGEVVDGRRLGAPGRVTEGALDDRIWNGADDVKAGNRILIDDGNVQLDVTGVSGSRVYLRVVVAESENGRTFGRATSAESEKQEVKREGLRAGKRTRKVTNQK